MPRLFGRSIPLFSTLQMPAPADPSTSLRFRGAAGEVTGSCCEVDHGGRFLVDCGMFQGGRDADARNLRALQFPDGLPEFVLVTHAHIDHSGLLPRLARLGFRGPVHATSATCDLLEVMLLDSAHIQEKDAQWRRERGIVAESLYTVEDAKRCLELLQRHDYGKAFSPSPGVQVRFFDAGHILGSAIVELTLPDRVFVFSGDLGQPGRPVLADPTPLQRADVLVVESTYGNRLHKTLTDTMNELSDVLTRTLPRGNVLIPAFAVGRTQEVLHVLADLARRRAIPPLNVFVDSPLASAATVVHARYASLLDRETRDLAAWQRAHPEAIRVRFTESVEDSKALNAIRAGAVVLAASGMCEAGRVRHHLRHILPRENCAVVFTGFQARGTLGRSLVDGANSVRLFREDIAVRASMHTIGGLSAHADRAALLSWLSHFHPAPGRTFVVHGEAEIATEFAQRIRTDFGWLNVEVPAPDRTYPVG